MAVSLCCLLLIWFKISFCCAQNLIAESQFNTFFIKSNIELSCLIYWSSSNLFWLVLRRLYSFSLHSSIFFIYFLLFNMISYSFFIIHLTQKLLNFVSFCPKTSTSSTIWSLCGLQSFIAEGDYVSNRQTSNLCLLYNLMI